MNKQIIRLVAITLTAFALPATSLAVGLYGSADANVNLGNNASSSARVDADAKLGAGASTTVNREDQATSSGNARGDSRGLENALIRVTANDAVKATTVITALIDVRSNDDFTAYAKGRMQADANLRDVQASDTWVSASYRVSARFLGFIPSRITAKATVNADGAVKVNYPWYRFLFATSNSNLSAKLASEVNASSETILSASEKARLLSELNTAFSAAVRAQASGSVSK